jgi:DNA modification methylase
MQLHVFSVDDLVVPDNRQRKQFNEQLIFDLAGSIAENGLIHPLVVRKEDGELILVAGERRLRALDICWGLGQEVRCGEKIIPERSVPCLFLGEIDPIDAFEIELEENIRRTDLDWQEKAIAVNKLFSLRGQQAARNGTPPPTPQTIAEEVSGTGEGQFGENVRQDIILARHLDNPVVASAASRKEAWKALKRDEERKRYEELGKAIGATFNSSLHTLLTGSCLEILPTLTANSFDIILTDPPYGISADEYGDSGGRTGGAHFYDDSHETWMSLMEVFANEAFRLAKRESHLYCFCDIDRFHSLGRYLTHSGWRVFRTPLVWVNPTAMRAPWPEHGPQRKYQIILFAIKGDRKVTRLYGDVITCQSDPNLGHQAQKPVELYLDLLRRSARPGDSVLDPFCGSGPVYPACHQLKLKATGIEIDPAAVGIASQRIKELT